MTVVNEKSFDSKYSAEELAKNLSRYGIDVVLEKVDAAGRSIGKALQMQAASCAADLLGMGAFGHSPFREFVLGGATKSLLSNPPIPVCFPTNSQGFLKREEVDCSIERCGQSRQRIAGITRPQGTAIRWNPDPLLLSV